MASRGGDRLGLAVRRVEPVERMVGGKFGFAYHRFPIKNGITPMEAQQILLGRAIRQQSTFLKNIVISGVRNG